MAQPDRNRNYMREVFGTTSLVTDYTPTKSDVLTLEDVINQLRQMTVTTNEDLDKTLETQLNDLDENPRSLEDSRSLVMKYLVEYGFDKGVINTAKLVLTYLEKLQ